MKLVSNGNSLHYFLLLYTRVLEITGVVAQNFISFADFKGRCCLGFPKRLVKLLKNFHILTSLISVAYKPLLIKDTKCTIQSQW